MDEGKKRTAFQQLAVVLAANYFCN